MGDRVAFIVHGKAREEISPTIYLHWGGSEAPELLKRLAVLMVDRRDDEQYCAARLCGLAHAADPERATGLGIWNTPDKIKEAIQKDDAAVLADYSPGNAGLVLVDASTFEWRAFGGYLAKS